ncbi:type III toxin-antitoxin system ToxN/AbiQ family toxin [Faecalibacillus faecis]|uniref:type III toxin-antitoxin system ToxN/AbiQ family toxin n=1 Tax=Faecalibacillus faecis TaxID=1982628 RepID=UPI002F9206E5
MFNEDDFKGTPINICYVKSDYLKYIRKFDYRIPIKTNRKFIGLVIRINGSQYVVPLTSKSSKERVSSGKRKRSPVVTTNLKDVADILHNNMFPVPSVEIEKIKDISYFTDPYLNYEYRLIRKKWVAINIKSMNVYRNRYIQKNKDYLFLNKICCDFKKLEEECKG